MKNEHILESKYRAYQYANVAFDMVDWQNKRIERLEERIAKLEAENVELIEQNMNLRNQLLYGGEVEIEGDNNNVQRRDNTDT